MKIFVELLKGEKIVITFLEFSHAQALKHAPKVVTPSHIGPLILIGQNRVGLKDSVDVVFKR